MARLTWHLPNAGCYFTAVPFCQGIDMSQIQSQNFIVIAIARGPRLGRQCHHQALINRSIKSHLGYNCSCNRPRIFYNRRQTDMKPLMLLCPFQRNWLYKKSILSFGTSKFKNSKQCTHPLNLTNQQ